MAEQAANLAKKSRQLTDQIRTSIECLSDESSNAEFAMTQSLNNSKILDQKAVQSGQASRGELPTLD